MFSVIAFETFETYESSIWEFSEFIQQAHFQMIETEPCVVSSHTHQKVDESCEGDEREE